MDPKDTSPIDIALIFLNSAYKNPLYTILKGVKADGEMMEEMLKNAYSKSSKRIQIMNDENTINIKENWQESRLNVCTITFLVIEFIIGNKGTTVL